MRLIDADALRSGLYYEAFETDTDMQRWDNGCWIRYKMFENALDNAPTIEAEPARQWISVEDRLPEIGKVVLAFGTRSASTGQFQGVGAKPWFWYWKGNTIRRVTHWMPLPEPPKEEDDV